MDRNYEQELMAFTLAYAQPEEIDHLGWSWATQLATARDVQAAEQLRMDCEG